MTLFYLFRSIDILLRLIRVCILVYWVLSLFRLNNSFYYLLARFVAPFVAPFKRLSMWVMRKTQLPIDFSVWFALIGLSIVRELLWRLYSWL